MSAVTAPALDPVTLLGELIRFNTVNPPGNERPAAEHLAAVLRDAGFEVSLYAATEQRPNVVARLRGTDDGPTLCLLSHIDTVLADPDAWSHDPWSGELIDGFVWGRGALDMKSQTAAEVAAAASLARSGWRPAHGDLLVVCVVDEEVGGALGAEWICEHHPDSVRCDMLLNEGGGWRAELDGGQALYGVGCAEKGVFRFKVITRGVAGHASIPRMGENALLAMAPLLARLAERQPTMQLVQEPRALLEALGESTEDPAGAVARLRGRDPMLALVVEPMCGVSLAPTRILASEKINVIPSRAELRVDCRVPPGLGEVEARAAAEEVLGREGYELEFTERVMGNRSPIEGPFMDRIKEWIAANDPGALCAPSVLPGFTDSRTFRAAFPDLVAYGFFPHRHMTIAGTWPLIHGADERIDVRDLQFATRFYGDIAQAVLGGDAREERR
ncbi:MAG TPA: M20/M25/M40 family metallo-hydrolase [Solirubrobacteraceae bacterium]|nr:M20/M25/M40 family metallo-hydrolase [Solirubrobacteraceae bacterium]